MFTITYPTVNRMARRPLRVAGGEFQLCLRCYSEDAKAAKTELIKPKKKGANGRMEANQGVVGRGVGIGGGSSLH